MFHSKADGLGRHGGSPGICKSIEGFGGLVSRT